MALKLTDESTKLQTNKATVGAVVKGCDKGPSQPSRRLTDEEIEKIYRSVSDPNGLLYHVAHSRR